MDDSEAKDRKCEHEDNPSPEDDLCCSKKNYAATLKDEKIGDGNIEECDCEHKKNLSLEDHVCSYEKVDHPVTSNIDNLNLKEYNFEHDDNPLPGDHLCCCERENNSSPLNIDVKMDNLHTTECKEDNQENCVSEGDSCDCKNSSPVPSRIASSAALSSIASFPEYNLNSNLTYDALKNNLAELVKDKGSDLIQACKNFDRRGTYKIHKTQLRQVLRTFCFPITAAQFEQLIKEVTGNLNEKINYLTFFTKLSGIKDIPISKKSKKIENIPIDEVELRIKKKIQPILSDIIRSFWLFDLNKDGLIQKAELRRIIKNYCFDLSDQLFDELWKLHDPKGKGVVDYKKFLLKLGINADRYQAFMPPATVAQALCWSDEQSKDVVNQKSFEQRIRRAALEKKDDPAIQGLPIEEVIQIFIERFQDHSKSVMRGFKIFDYENNGEIAYSDFCGVINFFLMPMSPMLFSQVLQRLDVDISPSCQVQYRKLFDEICEMHINKPTHQKSVKPDCLKLVQNIKNNVLNPTVELRALFSRMNCNEEFQIKQDDFKRALETEFELHISEEEFKELTDFLDSSNNNTINCGSFLKLFECQCLDDDIKSIDSGDCSKGLTNKYLCLQGDKLKFKFKHHFNKHIKDIEKAILICDPNQSGFIEPVKLKTILSKICFPLADDQFEELISSFKTYRGSLEYKEFLNNYRKKFGEDTKKWVATVNKLADYKSRCSPNLPINEVEEMLKECVQSRKSAMLKDFKILDFCHVGIVCKDDVRNVFNKFAYRFNDKQFEELWKKLPRNKFDQLLYDKFLQDFSQEDRHQSNDLKCTFGFHGKMKANVPVEKPDLCDMHPKEVTQKKPSKSRKNTKEIILSEAPHLRTAFDLMEPAVVRNVRTIRYHLNRADPKQTGYVDFTTLTNILAKSGIQLSAEEEFHILEYFDSSLSGKIDYKEFLKIFVWHA